jgi:tetratricopeptide (TPR) repeat protein
MRVKLANIGVGEAQLQAYDPSAALHTLRDMLARMSASEGIACNTTIARALTAQGDLEGARSILTKLLEDDIPRIFASDGIPGPEAQLSQQAVYARRKLELGDLYGNTLRLNLLQPARALPYLRASLAVYEERARKQPDADTSALAEVLMSVGAALRESDPVQSLEHYRRALSLTQGEMQARCRAEMALPLRKLGRRAEALAGLELSLASSDVLIWLEYGDALLEGGRTNEAYEAYRRARKEAEAAVARAPHWMHFRRDLADCYQRFGAYDAAQGMWANAREWYRKSLEIWRDWSKWGVSSVYDQTRLKAAAADLARCDARLAR